jgi:lipoyl(octanoyl) transferase
MREAAPCALGRPSRNLPDLRLLERDWCGREDSNFHGVSPTATSTLRVYQFRHDRRTAAAPKEGIAVGGAAHYQIPPGMASEMRLRMAAAEWRVSPGLVPYEAAVAAMEARVAAIRAGHAPELVWLLEHPSLYTAGTSARDADLVEPGRLPVFRTGRGGQYTYHGPGQRVAYVMLDLSRRGADVRAYVHGLEEWLVRTLATLGVRGERRQGRVGIWVAEGAGRESKIAAIGVRVRHWVSFHGVALNVDPDLAHYRGIVPCGITEHGVTSLRALGVAAPMAAVDAALQSAFASVFPALATDEPCKSFSNDRDIK